MSRKAFIHKQLGKIAIAIDEEHYDEILKFVLQDERYIKKFKLIVDLILEGHRNCDLFDKEDIDASCKDVYAMKFFKGQENARVYCKRQKVDGVTTVYVAAVVLSRKKNQKNSKKEVAIIRKVAGYTYDEIVEDPNNE